MHYPAVLPTRERAKACPASARKAARATIVGRGNEPLARSPALEFAGVLVLVGADADITSLHAWIASKV